MYLPDLSPEGNEDIFMLESLTPSRLESMTTGTIPSSFTPNTSTSSRNRPHGHSKEQVLFRSMSLYGSGAKQPRTLAPNLTRRSHKKSRAGCFTCKSRKIKCGEQKPKCGNCLLKGLDCIYPVIDAPRKRDAPFPLAKQSPTSASPRVAAFSMLDMRFFHHFLTTAYPHLPIGNDHVWVNEIPQFAEHQEYLMHAILALGASHLGRLTGTDYSKESLVHRGQAIAGLNQALSQKVQHYGEGDAMLAACYALTFQASYMGDGLADFITMVRGCALTTGKILDEEAPTAFHLEPDWHYKVMAPRLSSLPRVSPSLCAEGVKALEEIGPFLSTSVDRDFHGALIDVLDQLQESPQSGYVQFIGVYAVWYELCHDSFKQFLDPNNLIAQLLLGYFISIQMMMVPLAAYEWPERADPSTAQKTLFGTVEWAEKIFRGVEGAENAALRGFLVWPKKIIGIVLRELGGEPGGVDDEGGPVGVLQLRLPLLVDPPLPPPPPSEGSPVGSPWSSLFWEDASVKVPSVGELTGTMGWL